MITTLYWARNKMYAVIVYRYVAMSDNSKTGYKARELKSVHVDAVGQVPETCHTQKPCEQV